MRSHLVLQYVSEEYQAYPPASQNCMELLQWPVTQSQDLLSCGRVAEQVFKVSQRQVRFGLHSLLNAHLPTGVCLVLKLK